MRRYTTSRTPSLGDGRPWRDTAGFLSLGSQSKSRATAAVHAADGDVEKCASDSEKASAGVYDSEPDITSDGKREGRVEVRTELRQEVQRVESSAMSSVEQMRAWDHNNILTEITAKVVYY